MTLERKGKRRLIEFIEILGTVYSDIKDIAEDLACGTTAVSSYVKKARNLGLEIDYVQCEGTRYSGKRALNKAAKLSVKMRIEYSMPTQKEAYNPSVQYPWIGKKQ